MPKLLVLKRGRIDRELGFDRTVVVGRGGLADLSLDDPTVSRRHAMLRWTNGTCTVVDLQSENGTFVNGERVASPRALAHGDRLRFGTVEAEFQGDAPPAGADVAPSVVALLDGDATGEIVMELSAEGTGAEHFRESEGRALLDLMSRRLAFLNNLGKAIDETFDEGKLLAFVLDQVFELLPQAERAFVMRSDEQTGELVQRLARTRSGEAAEIAASRTLLEQVVARRQAVLVADVLDDERYARAQSVIALGLRSAICVPLVFQGRIYGVLQVDTSRAGPPFGKADLGLMVAIGAHVALSLAYADLHRRMLERELLERDVQLARRIQRQFLPQRLPERRGYRFAVEYEPALAVGGDYYDFLSLGGERIGIAVGDVSGKGVSAALYAAKLSSDLRYHSATTDDPEAILAGVNRALAEGSQEGMFATMILVELDPARHELLVVDAGHPPALLRSADGAVRPLGRKGGSPLGLDERARLSAERTSLAPGELVVLYTDGVTEAVGAGGALFGEERLVDAVARGGGDPERTVEEIVDAVGRFRGSAPQSDDLTLVVFGRRGK